MQSVTFWIEELKKGGNNDAAYQLWERYFHRLVGLAQRRLMNYPQLLDEAEHVALLALNTVFTRAEQGLFPRLNDRDDLWRLLVTITERRVYDEIRRHRPQQVSGQEASFLVDPTPDALFLAECDDNLRKLYALLPTDELRKVAEMKLEGHTNLEIADNFQVAVCTVERKLKKIRDCWQEEYQTRQGVAQNDSTN